MNEESNSRPKDFWDKLNIISKLVIAISIPIITGVATWFVTKQQSAPAAIDLAAQIYASRECDSSNSGVDNSRYCRSEDLDKFAVFLVKKYTGYKLPLNAGSTYNIPTESCVSVCEDDPQGEACRLNCGGPFR